MMKEFLEQRRDAFRDRGTEFMYPMVDEMLQMDIKSVDDLHEFVVECLDERNRHPTFGLKFMYYWSIHTYMVDMEDSYRRQYVC